MQPVCRPPRSQNPNVNGRCDEQQLALHYVLFLQLGLSIHDFSATVVAVDFGVWCSGGESEDDER